MFCCPQAGGAAPSDPSSDTPGRPPPKEPPTADEAPRAAQPETMPALGAAGGVSDSADSGPVCAVCGQWPRAAPLAALRSAAVRGTSRPLAEALTECLGIASWEPREELVCVPCTVLAGQAATPGPLQTVSGGGQAGTSADGKRGRTGRDGERGRTDRDLCRR